MDCSLLVDGKEGKSVMVTRVDQALEILVTGLGECGLTLVVVGGGGAGGGAGGGSGHLEYRSLQVTPGTLLTATVGRGGAFHGDQAQASTLAISGGETVTAQPGEDGHYSESTSTYDGGAGYSGGGGHGFDDPFGFDPSEDTFGGDGGSDGGDGGDGSAGSGGRGSGEDVSLYTFTTWSLGPGAGGEVSLYYDGRGYYYYGGGGGGLLVDGEGPQDNLTYRGQGYGGGGNGNVGYHDEGLPGLVLLEVN